MIINGVFWKQFREVFYELKLKVFGREILSFESNKKGFNEDYRRLINAALEGESPDIYSITEKNAYEKHVWVFACVNAIARNVSRGCLKFYKKSDDSEALDTKPHDLFYKNETPYTQLIEGIVNYVLCNGNSFLKLDNESGMLVDMHLLNSDLMSPVIYNMSNFAGYRYFINGFGNFFQREQIMHFSTFNPNSRYWGMSPIKAIILTLRQNQKARNFNDSIFENGSPIGLFFTSSKELSDPQYTRLKKDIENETRGVKKAGKPYLLENGMDVKDLKLTATDMQYIQQNNVFREEILGAFNVPAQVLGLTRDLNKANSDTSMKDFWFKTLIPMCKYISSIINNRILDIYFPDLYCKFDLTDIYEIQDDENAKVDLAVKLFSIGVPFNMINAKLNLGFEDLPWGDMGYKTTSLVPFVDNATTGAGVPPPVEPMKALMKILEGMDKKEIKSMDDVRKEKIWKKFDSSVRGIEGQYERKLSKFFFDVRKQVLDRLIGKSWKPETGKSLLDVVDLKSKLAKISRHYFEQAVVLGGTGALEDMDITDMVFNIQNQRSMGYIASKVLQIQDVVERMDTQLMKTILREGVEQGKPIDDVADTIREYFNGIGGRARVIAQTEILGAANQGRMDALHEAGITKKEWISSQDELVRETHRINGEVVGLNALFSNGLERPGDPNGNPEDTINCRCTLGGIV